MKRWPFGVVGDELLLFECAAQCCGDLTGFVIVDLGKEVNVFRWAGDEAVHDHGSAPASANVRACGNASAVRAIRSCNGSMS
jgi:hypothetical protein